MKKVRASVLVKCSLFRENSYGFELMIILGAPMVLVWYVAYNGLETFLGYTTDKFFRESKSCAVVDVEENLQLTSNRH